MYTYGNNNPLRFVDPTGLAYEDFENEAKTSIWSKIGTAIKNFFSGNGYKSDSELNIENRNKMTEGVGNDSTVASAQASLVMMDYDLGEYGLRKDGVDGDPGSKTQRALKEFQQAVGLEPTGKVDPKTMVALDLAVEAGFGREDLKKLGEALGHYKLVWPTESKRITSPFGQRVHPVTGEKGKMHYGIDIGAIAPGVEGDKIVSAASGTVVTSAYQRRGAGYYLTIESTYKGQEMRILYMHLQDKSTVVKQGEWVGAGQIIANMGTTGTSTAAHLHFEIRVNEGGNWVQKDPELWDYK